MKLGRHLQNKLAGRYCACDTLTNMTSKTMMSTWYHTRGAVKTLTTTAVELASFHAILALRVGCNEFSGENELYVHTVSTA